MAKGKLTKLKSMLKKWNSSNKLGRSNSNITGDETVPAAGPDGGLQEVYVGKSRRRYLISSHLVDHPLFRELSDRSSCGPHEILTVGCEVVLFEHLLWMLENADPQPESLDELVEFYAC